MRNPLLRLLTTLGSATDDVFIAVGRLLGLVVVAVGLFVGGRDWRRDYYFIGGLLLIPPQLDSSSSILRGNSS